MAEALSHFIRGDHEQSKAIAADLLGQPAIHKRSLLVRLLLALDVLRLENNNELTHHELSGWLGNMAWAEKTRRQMRDLSNQK